MENRDTLRQICYRLDDDALFRLTESLQLWRDVGEFLDDNSFWYQRTEHLAGRNLTPRPTASWKKMYYTLLRAKSSSEHWYGSGYPLDIFSPALVYALEDFDFLLLLIEIYGPPEIQRPGTLMVLGWYKIKNVDVLLYLLEHRYMIYDKSKIVTHIERASERGYADIIEALISFASSRGMILSASELSPILIAALGKGSITSVQALLDSGLFDDPNDGQVLRTMGAALYTAVEKGNPEAVTLLLSRYPYTTEYIRSTASEAITQRWNDDAFAALIRGRELELDVQYLFDLAMSQGREGPARLLLALGPEVNVSDQMLESAIRQNNSAFVKFLLEFVITPSKTNKILKLAALSRSETFAVVLADKSIDPTIDLYQVIVATWRITHSGSTRLMKEAKGTINKKRTKEIADQVKASPSLSISRWGGSLGPGWDPNPLKKIETLTEILVKDKRIRVEKLDIASLRAFVYGLEATINDRAQGFVLGSTLAGGSSTKSDMGRLLEGRSSYSIVLLFIVLKRPTNIELLDWMIERRDKSFQEAASCVLERSEQCDAEVALQALMLCILHPTLSLVELISDLQDQGMHESDIIRAGQLVGAYLGADRIQGQTR